MTSEAIRSARREAQQRGIDLLRSLRGWSPTMQDNPLSTLDKADTEIIHKLVAAARAAGLTRFTGSFASQMPMHRVGYSQVKFTWESGRHSIPGSIHIEWDARLQVEEKS